MNTPQINIEARRHALLSRYVAADAVGSAAPAGPVVGQCTGDRRATGSTVPAEPVQRWKQRYALYLWLQSFSDESIRKLVAVNNAAGSARHVLLALAYGICDRDIRRLNGVIIRLQVRRLQAQRADDQCAIEAIQHKLSDIHVAIDWITGTIPVFTERPGEIAACNKLVDAGGPRTASGGGLN